MAGARRAELLERVAAYLLQNGLDELSLRPLGAALGVSPRTLLYYFGSKERMLIEALEAARARQQRGLAVGSLSFVEGLRAYWRWAVTPAGRAYLRLLYQVYAITLQDQERFGGFFMRESLDWLAFCTAGLRSLGVTDEGELATLATGVLAAVRGLELDLLATGETERLALALEAAIGEIEGRAGT